MRLWSIHPQYLDSKGLVALWREGLLAQNVLLGKTKGYRNHPQLERFKAQKNPVGSIAVYLKAVQNEAEVRNYKFQKEKIGRIGNQKVESIPVQQGQIAYEFQHLKSKLKIRDRERYKKMNPENTIEVHPLFQPIGGGIESWERII